MSGPGEPSVAAHRRWALCLYRFTRNALAAFGLLCLVYLLGFDLSQVVSGSMAPALQGEGGNGSDRVLSERFSLLFRAPRRWEVVRYENDEYMVVAKRVIGLPGEVVSIQDRRILIDGLPVAVPASLESQRWYAYGNLLGGRRVACGTGYYMLGDDSRDSADSRYDGPIAPERFRGRAWLVVWPPCRMGFVNP